MKSTNIIEPGEFLLHLLSADRAKGFRALVTHHVQLIGVPAPLEEDAVLGGQRMDDTALLEDDDIECTLIGNKPKNCRTVSL